MESDTRKKFDAMRDFFASGATRDTAVRREGLRRLHDAIVRHEADIAQALMTDLHKSAEEAYISETGIVLAEIRWQIRHLRRLARPKYVRTPLFLLPSASCLIREPKGVVLVISPWNYPLQLSLDPIVGAVAAGCCVILKPSSTSAATTSILKTVITEAFPEEYVCIMDGGHEQTAELLSMRFDHIFFTGGATFGRTVAEQAARNLVPVTLELGGKSPCIVDNAADIDLAARKITWGKLMNAGQTCIAPDYLLVHRSVRDALVERIQYYTSKFYAPDPRSCPHYPRIISDKAFSRLESYLDGVSYISCGGKPDAAERFFPPTLVLDPDPESPLMRQEIFGPILPVLTFDELDSAIDFVNGRERPLALYYFGRRRTGLHVLSRTISGGACINDTIVHISNPNLPFGGTGASGMGRYHGRHSFETFSNLRATVFSPRRTDVTLRYPPYKRSFRLLRKLL